MEYKIGIPTEDARPEMVLAENIRVRGEDGLDAILVRAGAKLTETSIRRLKMHRVGSILVFSDEPPKGRNYPDGRTPPQLIMKSSGLPFEESRINTENIEPIISDNLQYEALTSIHSIFTLASGKSLVTAHEVLKGLDEVVNQLVEAVTTNHDGLVHVSSIKAYDEYTYHHSLSVAVLSVAIGQTMGLDKWSLRQLCSCAMMHDIGKIFLPLELINKPGKLLPEEFAAVKMHAENGAAFLEREGIGHKQMWEIIKSHHEKFSGGGYPHGLSGSEIPFQSRVIAVADVYDALTSYRAYRNPMPPHEAFEIIMSEAGAAFEYRIIKAFCDKAEVYPKGTILHLSNGRQGVATGQASHFLRPVIKMLDNGEFLDLSALNNLHLVVDKVDFA